MSTLATLAWTQDGAGYRAPAGADMVARVAPYGCSWAWTLVEGGVPAVRGVCVKASDALEAAAMQARMWPTLIRGALRRVEGQRDA